jgi:SAM-dependent methyltransferase
MKEGPDYYSIARHYERCFEKHGPTHKGMDWPNEGDLRRRFNVMLEVAAKGRASVCSVLDLGCGVGLLVDHIEANGCADRYDYKGIDVSDRLVSVARNRHPAEDFEVRDVLCRPLVSQSVDYVLMNGVLTEKVDMEQAAMESYACRLIKSAFDACRVGVAFNVMSTHVDWTRDDLFHWPLDVAANFVVKECSRHMVLRMDYGLYEYTVYVYRNAVQ